jgi:uncharacterized membrane protein
MKKYFKTGLALIIPLALVYQITLWIYDFSESIVLNFIPEFIDYQWWHTLAALLGIVIIIFMVGLIFSWIAPVRWIKQAIDKYILHKIPFISTVYKFGTEISDSFISDINQNGDLQVVEVMFAGQVSLGVLTDEKNHIVFVPTAPNPLNGFIVKTSDYKKLDMRFTELVKTLASLGRVNGSKWK